MAAVLELSTANFQDVESGARWNFLSDSLEFNQTLSENELFNSKRCFDDRAESSGQSQHTLTAGW